MFVYDDKFKMKMEESMMSEKNRDQLMEEVVGGISEEDLKTIAAAGDTEPEATPAIVSAVTAVTNLATYVFSCGKGCK